MTWRDVLIGIVIIAAMAWLMWSMPPPIVEPATPQPRPLRSVVPV